MAGKQKQNSGIYMFQCFRSFSIKFSTYKILLLIPHPINLSLGFDNLVN